MQYLDMNVKCQHTSSEPVVKCIVFSCLQDTRTSSQKRKKL